MATSPFSFGFQSESSNTGTFQYVPPPSASFGEDQDAEDLGYNIDEGNEEEDTPHVAEPLTQNLPSANPPIKVENIIVKLQESYLANEAEYASRLRDFLLGLLSDTLRISNPEWYVRTPEMMRTWALAFTNVTWDYSNNYDRLENRGDKVIGNYINEFLHTHIPGRTEEFYTNMFLFLSSNNIFSIISEKLRLSDMLRARDSSAKENVAVRADLLESFTGAFYIVSNMVMRDVLSRRIGEDKTGNVIGLGAINIINMISLFFRDYYPLFTTKMEQRDGRSVEITTLTRDAIVASYGAPRTIIEQLFKRFGRSKPTPQVRYDRNRRATIATLQFTEDDLAFLRKILGEGGPISDKFEGSGNIKKNALASLYYNVFRTLLDIYPNMIETSKIRKREYDRREAYTYRSGNHQQIIPELQKIDHELTRILSSYGYRDWFYETNTKAAVTAAGFVQIIAEHATYPLLSRILLSESYYDSANPSESQLEARRKLLQKIGSELSNIPRLLGITE